jgi:ABC-type nitrate/sulfonate/bicarbonate transport system permease component
MRYNHGYHQAGRTKQHRRLRVASLVFLLLLIAATMYFSQSQFDLHSFSLGFALSLYRVTLAYITCLVLALILGLLTTRSRRTENLLLPILDVSQSFPTFAILPVLVYYFGHSTLSVVAILVIAMVWPITFNVIAGVKEQRQDQAEAAQIFGARGWRQLVYYRWPMLRPVVITGSIVSWGQAWDTIVGAEIIAKARGAGEFLGHLGEMGQTPVLLLGIAVYLLLIFLINQVLWLPLLHYYTRYQAES